MVTVSYSCFFLRLNLIALRVEFLVKPVCYIFVHYPLRVSDESLVSRIRTTDSLQMNLGDITNVNDSTTACADFFLLEKVQDKVR